MAYTNAIFYLDFENGVDGSRTALTSCAFANNGSGGVRVTKAAHGLVTGAIVVVTLSTDYNSTWKITYISATEFDLDTAVYVANRSGTVTPKGGSSFTDSFKTIEGCPAVAGDTVRVAKSPDPVLLTNNGTWTCGPLPATQVPTSSSNTNPITVTKSGHGYSNGDIIQITAHTVNTAANGVWVINNVTATTFDLIGSVGVGTGGATGTMQKINAKCVLTDTNPTTIVTNCNAAWTLANSASTAFLAVASDAKEGENCISVTPPASPATGTKYAYYTLPAELDLTGYQKISFWIRTQVATAATHWVIKLCSDTLGATPVDEFVLPAIANGSTPWCVFTITKSGGGNMGLHINSIALYSGTVAPTGSKWVQLDHIIACKTDNLSLSTLISKGSQAASAQGSGPWRGIQSINGNIIMLDANTNAKSTSQNCFWGTGGADSIYFRDVTKPTQIAALNVLVPPSSGTATAFIEYQGGWNTSGGYSCDGETFIDGQAGYGQCFTGTRSYIKISKLNFCRWTSYKVSGTYFDVDCTNISNMGSSSFCIVDGGRYNTIRSVKYIVSGGETAFRVDGQSNYIMSITEMSDMYSNAGLYLYGAANILDYIGLIWGCTGNAVGGQHNLVKQIDLIKKILGNSMTLTGWGHKIYKVGSIEDGYSGGCRIYYAYDCLMEVGTWKNMTGYALNQDSSCTGLKIIGCTFSGNSSGTLSWAFGNIIFENCTFSDGNFWASDTHLRGPEIQIQRYNATDNDHRFYTDYGNAVTDATTRHTASGVSWKLSPTNVARTSMYPLFLPVAKVYCKPNKNVTVKAWMKLSSTTDVLGALRVRGGQIAGVDDDVQTNMATADTNWHEVTLANFLPTEYGMVTVEALAWWVASTADESVWIDDITITQEA